MYKISHSKNTRKAPTVLHTLYQAPHVSSQKTSLYLQIILLLMTLSGGEEGSFEVSVSDHAADDFFQQATWNGFWSQHDRDDAREQHVHWYGLLKGSGFDLPEVDDLRRGVLPSFGPAWLDEQDCGLQYEDPLNCLLPLWAAFSFLAWGVLSLGVHCDH